MALEIVAFRPVAHAASRETIAPATAHHKKLRLAAATARYPRQIRRKKQTREAPNDRHFDRKLDEKLKCMRPEDIGPLFRDEQDLNGE